jgi:uncharacterized protein
VNTDGLLWQRLGVIVELAKQSPRPMGRTALMKYCYLLQTLRRVPLGYDFRLYSYGPFDVAVLGNLDYAKFIGAVRESVEYYPGGYSYEIEAGEQAAEIKSRSGDFLWEYGDHIDWVAREFGKYSATELELVSTLIYVDKETASDGASLSVAELVRKVGEIKPHFTQTQIAHQVKVLSECGLLAATQTSA